MKLGSLTQALTEQAAMRKPAAVGNEPLTITPGQSLDLGPMVDDANVHDAGGYPDTSALTEPDRHKPESVPARRRRPLRKWTTARYVLPLAGQTPLLVSPGGIDALDIVYVVLTTDTINRVRYGPNGNDAQAGAYLPAVHPIRIEGGPVWVYGVPGVADVNLDVLVVYEDPSDRETGSTPGRPCGCDK